jgi:hypothetical protein
MLNPKYLLSLVLSLFTIVTFSQRSNPFSLLHALDGFHSVPDSTRTKVWWFHGETETTKEGITADLEAFKRAGVGGVVYYDQSHGKAPDALPGFSPQWWEMLRFAAQEARRLGLTFELHISDGYVAGGPWITDELSMKRLIATETVIKGGGMFAGKLEAPVQQSGFFRDVAVLALPLKSGVGVSSGTVPYTVTSNLTEGKAASILGSSSTTLTTIPASDSGAYINLKFGQLFEARSITYKVAARGKATTSATNVPGPPASSFVGTGYRKLPDIGELEASDDGLHYYKVCSLKPIYKAHESWRQKTIAFNPVKAKYYRLYLHDWWEKEESNKSLNIGSVVLNAAAKLDQWEEKAGLFAEYMETESTPAYAPAETIASTDIMNVTAFVDSAGTLRWNAPAGNWMILRFAYVSTGANIKHGRKNLIGRECDKLSAKAAVVHWDNYVGRILDTLQATPGTAVAGIAMDSHEAGAQNWTDNFMTEFKSRRGYDLTRFLPVMAGYIVDGVKESAGFLYDVRRNIADLMSDNYYGVLDSLCRKRGLVFTAQAIGNALCIAGDPIQAKSKVNKPQGEFWVIHPDGNYDIKESSSAAHLYGKKIASAEAYTDAKYSTSVAELKSLADYAYAFGINEFVICASAYQPWLDKVPGSTGGGRQYAINRNNTWWNFSRPFWDFQSRNAHLMRGGASSIDLCVYLGENAPVKILTYRLPDIPGGFDFEAFTSDALINRMTAKNGKIYLPDGVAYKMMILPRNGDISLPALRKIASIVREGGRVYGAKPAQSGSFADWNEKQEYDSIAGLLWGRQPATYGSNTYGKGMLYWGSSLGSALIASGISPDIAMASGDTKHAHIYFAHRKFVDGDLYFVDNHKDSVEDNIFTFAATGKQVQLWNTVTGERFAIPIKKTEPHSVSVHLQLAPRESFFVVLTDQSENLPAINWPAPTDKSESLNSDWDIVFDAKAGGPGYQKLPVLRDWTAFTDPSIKYYSGTAVYSKTVFIRPFKEEIFLDIGNPGSIAQVLINGKDAGIIWCSPWQLKITSYLRSGDNEIKILVANSLMNRMIYDAQLPENKRITYAYPMITDGTESLIPSGLKAVKLIRRTKL